MSIRLYMDEDSMDRALVQALRVRGVDTLTAEEAGMANRPDADHLALSSALQRTLCTFNVGDFSSLHVEYLTQGKQHAGIILVHQQRYSVGEQLRRMLRLTAALSASDMINRAEYLSAWPPLA